MARGSPLPADQSEQENPGVGGAEGRREGEPERLDKSGEDREQSCRLQAEEGNLGGNRSASWRRRRRRNSVLSASCQRFKFLDLLQSGRQHEDRGFVKLGALVRKEVG